MSLSLIGVASAFAELVPTIAKWFGDDADLSTRDRRSLVDHVLHAAKKITGTNEAAFALQALKSDPQRLLAFQREVLKLERSLERNEVLDRKSARDRDQAFVHAGQRNFRADIMVFCAALGLLACLISLAYFKHDLPGEAVGIISTIAGIFGSCLKDSYSFEFGSSRGSKAKDIAAFLTQKRSFKI